MPFETFLHTIHSVSAHPQRWSNVLDGLNRAFAGRCVVLASYDFCLGRGRLIAQTSGTADVRAAYEGNSPTNPYFLSERPYAQCAVLIGSETVNDDELIKTDYYCQLLRPRRLFRRLTGVLSHRDSQIVFVCINRCREQAEFSALERGAFAEFLPHIALARDTQEACSDAGAKLEALAMVAEQCMPGMLIVDDDLRIVFKTSDCAGTLTPGLLHESPDGHLMLADQGCERKLRREIADCRARGLNHLATLKAITLSSSCNPTITLRLRYVGKQLCDQQSTTRDLFCLTQGSDESEGPEQFQRFADAFRLTAAETRVGELIVKGSRPAHVARTLHISPNTVRSHLKDIFSKTGTHGQLELFRLFMGAARDDFGPDPRQITVAAPPSTVRN
jgi:DNA-binding CsgD family transcriptional regulator